MGINLPLDMGIPNSPFPNEGQDESTNEGMAASAKAGFYGSLGGTGIARVLQQFQGGERIPHDEAAQALKEQGYDPAAVPKDGWTSGALQIEMNRQSIIRRNQDIANRAHLSSTTRFVSGLAGGFADPANLALLPLGGPLASAGKTVAGRVAVGGVVGALYAGGADVAQNALTGHNEDDASLNTLRDIVYGTAIGGGLHAAFGGREPQVDTRIEPGPMTLGGISELERSGAAARRMGVAINDVVSPAGAVGEYQIMPETAAQYGFDPARLHDKEYAQHAAQKILDALNTHFKGDGEAVAVAWNAGPGRADRWLRAGKNDSLLPAETRDYLARYRAANGQRIVPHESDISQAVDDLPPDVRDNAAKTAILQMGEDSPVNVQPVIDAGMVERYGPSHRNALSIRDEHDAEVQRITSEGMRDAIPQPSKLFEMDKDELDKAIPPLQPKPEVSPEEKMGPLEAEAKEHADAAQKEVEALHANLGEDVRADFKDQMAKAKEAESETDRWRKAVGAAVQCTLTRGAE